jgi:membrane protease YdiL (CAAX protease family)
MKTQNVSPYTFVGLLLAFFGPTLLLGFFRSIAPDSLTNSFVIVRELSLFLMAALLILIIVKGEKLDLESIGLHGRNWGKSIMWSFIMMVIFIAAVLGCLGFFKLVNISYGQNDHAYDHVSLWVMTLVMIRAGVVEEIFYRGYAMERLHKINSNWMVYFLFPSALFALMHYRQGIGGIIIAFVGGLVISFFYWKRRDLKANILAHFMVDFIPNVLIPLISGES